MVALNSRRFSPFLAVFQRSLLFAVNETFSRRDEGVDILERVFQAFLMVLKIAVVDFLGHAAFVPFPQNVAGRTVVFFSVTLKKKKKKEYFVIHAPRSLCVRNCADRP